MSWSIIDRPQERAESQVHLSVSVPQKRGSPRFYISIPTKISGQIGFDGADACNVYSGSGENAGKIYIKPEAGGQRSTKWREEVFMVQLEMLPGMSLNEHSEHVDYEVGPEKLGIIITVPQSFFADASGNTINRAPAEKPGGLELKGTSLILGSKQVTLTPNQAAIVNLLNLRFGKVVEKKHLHDELYQLDPNGGADEKVIDVYICKIRVSLKTAKMPIAIITHHGMGYELRNAVA